MRGSFDLPRSPLATLNGQVVVLAGWLQDEGAPFMDSIEQLDDGFLLVDLLFILFLRLRLEQI